MATAIYNFAEDQRVFYPVAGKHELKPDVVRRVRASRFRYCLGDNYMYMPSEDSSSSKRLCWARVRPGSDDQAYHNLQTFIEHRSETPAEFNLIEEVDISIGNTYAKRYKEENGKFVPVPEFCSQALIDGLAENPEALPHVSREDFENLCAELFVRRGFKVDLFRKSRDGGIDFIAVQDDRVDPIIFAIQTKQPDVRAGKSRKSLGRPIIQQIYGAAKAWDLNKAIAISGSTYSPDAKSFVNLKSAEMELFNGSDVLKWIQNYRWNEDEMSDTSPHLCRTLVKRA